MSNEQLSPEKQVTPEHLVLIARSGSPKAMTNALNNAAKALKSAAKEIEELHEHDGNSICRIAELELTIKAMNNADRATRDLAELRPCYSFDGLAAFVKKHFPRFELRDKRQQPETASGRGLLIAELQTWYNNCFRADGPNGNRLNIGEATLVRRAINSLSFMQQSPPQPVETPMRVCIDDERTGLYANVGYHGTASGFIVRDGAYWAATFKTCDEADAYVAHMNRPSPPPNTVHSVLKVCDDHLNHASDRVIESGSLLHRMISSALSDEPGDG